MITWIFCVGVAVAAIWDEWRAAMREELPPKPQPDPRLERLAQLVLVAPRRLCYYRIERLEIGLYGKPFTHIGRPVRCKAHGSNGIRCEDFYGPDRMFPTVQARKEWERAYRLPGTYTQQRGRRKSDHAIRV